ncbi:hypothetical protein [Halochromatium roseum]|uniref:hypothetical protein n=1 Tax=Halochromatium roseum TaxID=391920 RepID=UPI001913863C|nr:hypothetical protein [Halochromatium roseum]MBK5939651.1 hypothetical protein [Halochromatium roseum]
MFSVEDPAGLARFGFKFGKGGVHAARTMMLAEVQRLFEVVPEAAQRADYRQEIVDDNLLDKPTANARKLSFRHLCDLYALDPDTCLFRIFRRLWSHQSDAQPVLALQLSLARDALLRISVPIIRDAPPGAQVTREQMEQRFAEWSQGGFSPTSIEAIAQRVNGSWTQAGYLSGHVKKLRARPLITPVNLTFGLFLAYLEGRRAQRLFSSDWLRVLDLPEEQLIALTQAAAQRGLLVFRRTGAVMEVRFPGYLSEQEQEWLHEQA